MTVATLFTEAGGAPYTLSARRYLHQVGARNAQALYQQRRAEDRAALEPLEHQMCPCRADGSAVPPSSRHRGAVTRGTPAA